MMEVERLSERAAFWHFIPWEEEKNNMRRQIVGYRSDWWYNNCINNWKGRFV